MNSYISAFPGQQVFPRHQVPGDHAQACQSLYMAGIMCAFLYRVQDSATEQVGVDAARDVTLRLTRSMGLSMSSAADVLHVTRATLYSWLKLEREPQTAQMNRIDTVKRALTILENESANGQQTIQMHAVLPGGHSVLSLLTDDAIDYTKLQSTARLLSHHPAERVVDITDEELDAEPVAPKPLVKLFQDMSTWKNG